MYELEDVDEYVSTEVEVQSATDPALGDVVYNMGNCANNMTELLEYHRNHVTNKGNDVFKLRLVL